MGRSTCPRVPSLSEQLPEVALLRSIPDIGDTLAPIIFGEIGDVDRFMNAKQLVAFSGIDPSVRQSGNFVGTKNKVTKRGRHFCGMRSILPLLRLFVRNLKDNRLTR
ncbi:transposase [Sporomusa malonica]|uniref:transposase n=1 Tax=Sporomusa malonica TaxID=112901 RepID=UPI001593291B|nr:transposase [Sporomusa malonica]